MRRSLPTPDREVLGKLLRYSGASAAGIVITQVLLLVGHGILGAAAGPANAVAVMVTAGPVYVMNRAWVWQVTGPNSLRREVVPFWGFTLAGLVVSTLAVAGTASLTDSPAAMSAANVGAFGALWVVKFLVLDAVVFARPTAA